jgi:predicted nucleotidyltransferase
VGIDEDTIRQIVERITEIADPKRIILFGSVVTEQMTPDSDIDLLVVEDITDNSRSESVKIRKALRGLGYPIDVIVMPTERFDESKEVFGGIAYPAYTSGKTIYEAA